MTIALGNITGVTAGGLTSPTYAVTADTPPDAWSKQWAILSLGGTQSGVDVHSASKPFTLTFWKVPNYKFAPIVNANGFISGAVPRNVFKALIRKGMVPVSGQPANVGLIRVEIDLPAGCDITEPTDVDALLNAGISGLYQVLSGLTDTVKQNVL